MSTLLEELQWRGFVAQHTDLDALAAALEEGPVTFYTGFDPSAASLHHGHLVALMLMKHLQNAGHKPLALVGGATGLIGDPRMSGERTLNPTEVVADWADKLKVQISRFLSFEGENAATMVNNYDWTKDMSAITLMRDLGKHFRMGTMLAKESVAARLRSDEGLSFTEFSYQILQANDYAELYRRYGCTLQAGGNDQWGNIIGGVDFVRKSEGATVHALTTPLITKADGTKFGKSEGGAIWLDSEMFSPYDFFQFWINVDDIEVPKLLKIFTLLPREDIERIIAESEANPRARLGQRTLAREVTTLVHGEQAAKEVEAASEALFGGGDLAAVDAKTLADATAQLPCAELTVGETTVVDVLVASGLEKGRNAARRTVASGGAYLNNAKVEDEDAAIGQDDLLPGGRVLVRRGRRNLAVAVAAD
ncbi:tyrosine--tRNA ligase [Bowdeniella nasicola]|uniref:Tyrosine--tRNA ligase n=1 Tax=Bowdeniella nasicola TaxID=208480 RepID=A0A1Q5Q186_9ACTO|nr:tyrosine--tRNA ligase [Bowdeniella nasicola]OKL53485.1 tyrosine--tRNA ligase [Bowdeniella nasicola]